MWVLALALIAGCSDARIDALEARVATLEAENDALAEQLRALESGAGDAEGSLSEGAAARDRLTEPMAPPPWMSQDADGTWVISEVPPDDELARLGRVVPHLSADGAVDGYRVSGIRRGSAGDLLGLRNGDVVRTFDGKPLDRMSSVMELVAKLHGDPGELTFGVLRRGEPVEVVVRVR